MPVQVIDFYLQFRKDGGKVGIENSQDIPRAVRSLVGDLQENKSELGTVPCLIVRAEGPLSSESASLVYWRSSLNSDA